MLCRPLCGFDQSPNGPLDYATAPGGFSELFRQTRAQAGSEPRAQAQAAAGDARAEDRAAVKASLESFVKAFVARDAEALAGQFTNEGEYHSVESTRVRGKEAIEKGFAAFFARSPEVTAEIHSDGLRFVSAQSAERDPASSNFVFPDRRSDLDPRRSRRARKPGRLSQRLHGLAGHAEGEAIALTFSSAVGGFARARYDGSRIRAVTDGAESDHASRRV